MSHDHAGPGARSPEEIFARTRAITQWSVTTAFLLMTLKAFAWGASGSVSLLASLADSALDLVASLGVFFAVRWAAAPPDEEHRYGYGKAEAFAGLVQAGLVFVSAAFVGWEAIGRIRDPQPVEGGAWGVLVMLISIALTFALVQAQTRALKETGSVAVAGDRAHYFADLASNVAALIGVGAAVYLNAPMLDAAAGLVVAVWLFWGALNVMREAADHLVDRSLPQATRARIVEAVLKDPRISGVHQLRTRQSGPYVMIQLHADLEPSQTLEQAHAVVVEAEQRILAILPAADIIIHPDPKGRAEPHGGALGEAAGEHR